MEIYTPPPVEVRLLTRCGSVGLSSLAIKTAMRLFANEIFEYANIPEKDMVDNLMREMHDRADFHGDDSIKILSAHQRNSLTVRSVREIVGAIELSIFENKAILQNIAVRRDKQRQGIGSLLLQMAEDSARYDGARTISFSDNSRNRDFYKNHGFLIDEDCGCDEIKGVKILQPFHKV